MLGYEIETYLRSMLDEPRLKEKYYTSTELMIWFNIAYKDFVKKTYCVVQYINIPDGSGGYENDVPTTALDSAHIMPSDFVQLDVTNKPFWADGDTITDLTVKSLNQLIAERGQSVLTATGTPDTLVLKQMQQYGGVLSSSFGHVVAYVFPIPATAGTFLNLDYTPVVDDIDVATAPLLTDDDIISVCNKVIALGKRKRLQLDEASYYDQLYAMNVNARLSETQNSNGTDVTRPNRPWLAYNV